MTHESHSFPLSRRAVEATDAPISWLMAQALEVPGMLSLAAGFVDQETLPADELRELAMNLLSDPEAGKAALQYGTTLGDPRLRRTLVERLRAKFNAPVWSRVEASDVMVTTGSQQFLYLLAETLCEPGDLVLVEDPSYFVYVGALKSFGCRLLGVPCDPGGMLPQALDAQLRAIDQAGLLARVKILYVMSYSQNPMGVTLSASRRREIWQVFQGWIDRGLNAVLLEDAAYREVRFPGVADVPPFFELQDEVGRVCYTESFSKALAPGLRLGYGVAPAELHTRMGRFKSHHDFGSSNFAQQLVLSAMETGLFDRHVGELGVRYQNKCELLREILQEGLGDALELLVPQGGLYLWARAPEGIHTGTSGALFKAAMEEKVLYVPGEMCAVPCGLDGEQRQVNRRSMRLCYAFPADSDLVEAGGRLVKAVRRVLDARSETLPPAVHGSGAIRRAKDDPGHLGKVAG